MRLDEALASYDKAIALKPDYAGAFSNRGLALHELKRLDEALASYERALSVRPDYADAHWNEALLRLLAGDFSRGWAKYEWRWKLDERALLQRNFSKPLWLGADAIDGNARPAVSAAGRHSPANHGDGHPARSYAWSISTTRARSCTLIGGAVPRAVIAMAQYRTA
jgi:tetratricopeptide (TPR) repeat protein